MAVKLLRDPIYEYIELNELEQAILHTLHFQRLRRVLQNSTAYLTYPSSTHTRFSHSLGVMHLAGCLAESAFRNMPASHPVCAEIANQFGEWLAEASVPRSTIAELSKTDHVLEITRQLARLIGMLHDIGHPPFSHLSERLLDDTKVLAQVANSLSRDGSAEDAAAFLEALATPGHGQVHEVLGYFTLLEPAIVSAFKSARLPYFTAVGINDCAFLHSLLERILAPTPEHNAIRDLFASIIDSDIGADKLDYVARDGHFSAIGMGGFDLQRILYNVRIHTSPPPRRTHTLLPTVNARSAVESLLLERFKLYCYLYYHHKVIATDELLQRVLAVMLRIAALDAPSNSALSYPALIELDPAKFSWRKSVEYGIFFDDTYLWHALHRTYALLNPSHPELSSGSRARITEFMAQAGFDARLLVRFIEGIVHRKRIALSVWKTYQGMKEFEEIVGSALLEALRERWRKQPHDRAAPPQLSTGSPINAIADRYFVQKVPGRKLMGDFEDHCNRQISDYRVTVSERLECRYYVLIAYRPFKAFELTDSGSGAKPLLRYVVGESSEGGAAQGTVVDLMEISPLIGAIREAWGSTPHLFVYLIPHGFRLGGEELISDDGVDLSEAFAACKRDFEGRFVECLVTWFDSCVREGVLRFDQEQLLLTVPEEVH